MDTRPLKVAPFRRLWASTAVTAIGSQLTAVAVPKQVYDITNSSGYVGLAGAVERRTATALPAFTLVLALTLAAFGGMVNGSIIGGQITYSWQATGADAVVDTNGAAYDVTPAVEKSIMAIPGVRHSAAVWTTTWQTPDGQQQLNVAAVDPAGYAAMTADTPFPRIPVSALGPPDSAPVSAATV
ncbi:MAG TPA: hypothetical protein VH352_18435, partial [Pseudonocardiaceae bacterium]|nr:hypothetical protein [Pseudonocardiaceae bacterium]